MPAVGPHDDARKEPRDSEAINTVFCEFHTIEGLTGFLALDETWEVAHKTETLLDLARNQKLRITSAVVDIVLAAALSEDLDQAPAESPGGEREC